MVGGMKGWWPFVLFVLFMVKKACVEKDAQALTRISHAGRVCTVWGLRRMVFDVEACAVAAGEAVVWSLAWFRCC
jgi:hypothetical protein